MVLYKDRRQGLGRNGSRDLNLQLITRENFEHRRWRQPEGFAFAAGEWLVPLGITELATAVLNYPIAFAARGDLILPYALLGFSPGQNLLVGVDGTWRATAIPILLRNYPFRLVRIESGERALAVDMDSGLVDDAGPELFFEAGAPSARLVEIQRILVLQEQGQMQAAKACAALSEHGVLVPWPLTVRSAEGDRQLEGLLKIDEEALGRVPGPVLEAIRSVGGLPVAYCHLLATQQLALLARRLEAPAQSAPPVVKEWPEFSGIISFEKLA